MVLLAILFSIQSNKYYNGLRSAIMSSKPTDIEKESLEAHVELCSMRYAQLESRLGTIETKVGSLATKIEDSQSSMSKVIIGATGTIVASLLSVVIVILMKF